MIHPCSAPGSIRSLSEDDRFQVVGYAINAFDAQEKDPQAAAGYAYPGY